MIDKLKEIKKALKDCDLPVYLAGHEYPDNDSIGSCLAVARLLEKLGKKAYVLLNDEDRDILAVHQNQHLVTNKVHDEKYWFCSLDLNDTSRLINFEKYFKEAQFTINIDHHQGNYTNANIVLSDQSVSSTCEIIYHLYTLFGREYFDKSIAESLYTGIMTDTSVFARRLSSQTLSIAQKLLNFGINYEYLIANTYSKRTLYELKALALLVNEIKFDECLHYLIIDKSLPQFSELTHTQITKTIAEELRKIDQIDTFFIFVVESDHIVSKCMSNITKNANVIARHFGGGGHKGEAGFTIRNITVEEIIKDAKDFIKSLQN